jgi:hypothetical protein
MKRFDAAYRRACYLRQIDQLRTSMRRPGYRFRRRLPDFIRPTQRRFHGPREGRGHGKAISTEPLFRPPSRRRSGALSSEPDRHVQTRSHGSVPPPLYSRRQEKQPPLRPGLDEHLEPDAGHSLHGTGRTRDTPFLRPPLLGNRDLHRALSPKARTIALPSAAGDWAT